MDSESCVLNIIRSKNGGILESDATEIACKSMSQALWLITLRKLVKVGIIKRIEKGSSSLLQIVEKVLPLQLTGHQLSVYRIIDMVGSKGITEDEIISKLSGKSQPHKKDIKQALKSLFQFGHVQKIRSIQNRKEMMYIVAGIEPEKSLTGGKWYNAEKEFDTSYVHTLRQACISFFDQLKKDETINASIVHRWLLSRSENLQSPTIDEISQILFTLELDGIVEEFRINTVEQHGKGVSFADSKRSNIHAEYKICSKKKCVSLFESSCTSCQYLDECDPHCLGLISPITSGGSAKCPYLEEWLA